MDHDLLKSFVLFRSIREVKQNLLSNVPAVDSQPN